MSQGPSDDEAIEENVGVDDQSTPDEEEEESGEDLINDNMANDYRPIPELDRYEDVGLDDNPDYVDINAEQRRRAEEEIERRHRIRLQDKRHQRLPDAMRDLSDQDEMEIERHYIDPEDREDDEDTDVIEEERYLNLEEVRGKLQEWIKDDRTKSWIRRTFRRFLNEHKAKPKEGDREAQECYYANKIKEMCQANRQSLEMDYGHIVGFNSTIALWIAEEPKIILPHLNEVARSQVYKRFPNYYNIHSEIFIRIVNLPILDTIRELRYKHLEKLIRVIGVITRRSAVYSQLKEVNYACKKCGHKKGPFFLDNNDFITPGICHQCQSAGPFEMINNQLVYRNFQKLTLQESPGSVRAGRVPRSKEVVIIGDQIDIARPGDEVEVTGVYTQRYDYALNIKHGFPLYSTIIESNYIRRIEELETLDIDRDTRDRILKLAEHPRIDRKIYNSVAPSIYGHQHVKMAIALAMFGGVAKDIQQKHRIRGDINVLILGDPGTAKSQFLKNVEKTFYRSIYTTGKGASAVGLTASVRRDYTTNEWSLEGGALVQADNGICLIDEFDKMNEHDRTSIHEAMEQQSISISKAGIVATLHARCSVIAAANPVEGKYNSQLSFHDNVDLTDPILSRFDVLCVVKDEVYRDADESLASFVINSHISNHPKTKSIFEPIETDYLNKKTQREKELELQRQKERQEEIRRNMVKESTRSGEEVIDKDLLKKYIKYARTSVHPKISNIDQDKLTKFYYMLRKESELASGINIAVRHLESIIRMAEAHARMHLRSTVTDYDVSVAIRVMLESFLQSQKYSVAKTLRRKFMSYLSFNEDTIDLTMNILQKLYQQQETIVRLKSQTDEIRIAVETLQKKVKENGYTLTEDFFESAKFQNRYHRQNNYILLKH